MLLDLKKNGALGEDFFDAMVAEQRAVEPGDTVASREKMKEKWPQA